MYDLSFAYANSRVKAMKSKLFDRDRMRELLDSRTLDEFIELLEESPYKSEFVAQSTRLSGFELVKQALDDNLVATLKRIASIIPRHSLALYTLLVRQWEINNVKKIIASKAIGKPVGMDDLLPAQQESAALLSKLLACGDLAQVVSVLKKTPYAPAIASCEKEFTQNGDFRILTSALDVHYYAALASSLATAGDAFTLRFIRDKLDFANALVILRMKKSGVSSDEIRRHLAPGAGRKLVKQMLAEESVEKSLAAFCRLKHLDAAGLEAALKKGGLSEVEADLDRALLVKARQTVSRAALSMGVIVAFLHLKQEEVHSLRKIAYATQFDVKDEIRERVLSAA